ncbi:hypothetical protein LOD99_10354 [Oopsacas minuta]|uniref:Uncharacterized protein n=1 Tax=Oopsacas minuta TaxID=111878 RepID=A0AAV7KHR0_9METZ|nr:hypothetical protein LOD99_10354 [Oopsacas minuta]
MAKSTTNSSPMIQGQPILNVALLGEYGVGKTSLIRRFKYNIYNEGVTQETVGDFEDVICIVPLRHNESRSMRIRLHDTAGMEKDSSLTSNYYRHKDGIILTWDLTREETYRRLGHWEQAALNNYRDHDIPQFIVVANKCENQEMDSKVYQQCLEYSQAKKYSCFKTSARDSINVKQAFHELLSLMGKVYEEKNYSKPERELSRSVDLENSDLPIKDPCCN